MANEASDVVVESSCPVVLPGVGGAAVVSALEVVDDPVVVASDPVVVDSAVVAGVEAVVSDPVVETPVTAPVVEPDEEVEVLSEVVVPATHDGIPAESNVQVSELWQHVIELIPEVIPPQQVVLAGHTFHSFGEG